MERYVHARIRHSSLYIETVISKTFEFMTSKNSKMENEKLETLDPYATPPKLTLNSFSSFSKRAQDIPGMATPPIRLSVAIPFEWEEAPGRPKQKPAGGADADRRLGLPPRLSAPASGTRRGRRGTNTASPTTVLDGHYFMIRKRPVSFSVGRRHLSFGRKDQKEMKVRWDASSERSSVDTRNSSASSSSSSLKSLSSVSVNSYSNGGEESDVEEEEVEEEIISKEEAKVDDQSKEEERKVRILRYRRKRNLTCVTTCSASHFLPWASILGRLKQAVVVPCWRGP